jgi:5-methyltetrahydrofolate--homocysteine methyltransferase
MKKIMENETLEEVKQALASEQDPLEIIDALRSGIADVGEKFETGELFLVDLIMAAEILNSAMDLIKPLLLKSSDQTQSMGTLVIGTVQGDVHDIGKNIFVSLMEAAGYKVIDLGVDVPPEKFVQAIQNHKATLVGLSTLLSKGLDGIKSTIEHIKQAGLRNKVNIMVGGSILENTELQQSLNADFVTVYASAGVKYALNLKQDG